jgi:serine/threonine protein kinase/WD40 repeat protein/Tfp pilus assembly protein PilF
MEPAGDARNVVVAQLAQSFMERMRRGERPPISDYADQYPDLADEIREVFPALAVLEEFGPTPSGAADAVVDAPELDRLGEYRIVREVGRGGMGLVYEAVQEPLGRHVALKVLPAHLSRDPLYRERFHREARVAARLHHSNIVPVFDVGEHNGTHYYAMQFIQGLSLDEVMLELRRMRRPPGTPSKDRTSSATHRAALSQGVASSLLSGSFAMAGAAARDGSPHNLVPPGPSYETDAALVSGQTKKAMNDSTSSICLPGDAGPSDGSVSPQHYYRSVARVGLQVADALSYVHAQGLLHRDVKPSNLLLDTRGIVWITDLGLAREEDGSALTRSGDVVGTLRYMAPERFRGEAYPSSDLYSLGLTLYEMLTFRAAFDQSDRGQLMHQITSADPPGLRKIDSNLPRDLETIVLKAIDKDALRRYQTGAELSADLRSFLEDRPIRARRTSVFERSWRWCRRNRAIAALMGSVAALLLVLAVGGWLSALLFRDQAAQLLDKATKLRLERALATQRLYEALLAQAQASRRSGRVGQRIDSLRALSEAAALVPQLGLGAPEQLTLRDEAIACLALTDLRTIQPPHRTPSDSKPIAFDPELKHYVESDLEGNLSIRRTNDHGESARLAGWGIQAHVGQFSARGHYLAVKYHAAGQSTVRVWDLERRQVVLEVSKAATAFNFSDDGRLFAIGTQDKSIQIYELPLDAPVKRLVSVQDPDCIRFSPQGDQVAVSSNRSAEVRIVDWQADRVVSSFRHPKPVYAVSWQPGGSLLACACADQRVYVWNIRNRREQAVLVGHQAEVVEVSFGHSGSLLASYGWDGTTRLWDPWTGQQLISASGAFRQFSPDDRLLGFTGEPGLNGTHVGIWEVATAVATRSFSEPNSPNKGPACVDIGLEGRLMITAGSDGIRIWDIVAGKELATLSSGVEHWARFAGDGNELITSGINGLYRWPIRRTPESDRTSIQIGPPKQIGTFSDARKAATDQSGQTIGVIHGVTGSISGDHAHLIRGDSDSEPVQLRGHPSMSRIALSSDGEWVATGTWQGVGVKLWESRTGTLVRDLFESAQNATVTFTPDGKWLVAGANGVYRFWEVGTWKHSHDIPGSFPHWMAFTSDGSMMAMAESRYSVRLVDPANGLPWATLISPNPQPLTGLSFSPDGSQLAAACSTHVVQCWNLRNIREQLASLGLDWDLPQSPAVPSSEATEFAVRVDAGDLRASSSAKSEQRLQQLAARIAAEPNDAKPYKDRAALYYGMGEITKAIADFEQSLEKNPDQPAVCNDLAWTYANAPSDQRRLDRAIQLAQIATTSRPDKNEYHNTLGVLYYRLGQWNEAIAALDRAIELNPNGGTAFDWYFLAMCYHRIGQLEKARSIYQSALDWVAAQHNLAPSWVTELKAFRSEAEEVLGLAKVEAEP